MSAGMRSRSGWTGDARAKKEKQRVNHVKLVNMDQLESLANRCASVMYEIRDGLGEYYRHEESGFSNAQRGVQLDFDPEPQWVELPVRFVAPLKALTREYAGAAEWITCSSEWADTAEQRESELERLAFHGLKVLAIVEKIRKEIDAGERGTPCYRNRVRQQRDERSDMRQALHIQHLAITTNNKGARRRLFSVHCPISNSGGTLRLRRP